jgi:hypothetical protein
MRRLNCWEFMKCGREPDGKNAGKDGVCPVALEERLDGVHGGVNAGRACWVVAGSLCGGKPRGTFAQKYLDCKKCSFYLKVREEESPLFEYSFLLLKKLEDEPANK